MHERETVSLENRLSKKTMEKTITLTSDELCRIKLAVTDKITSIKASAVVLGGYNNIPFAAKRMKEYEQILKKLSKL